MAYMLDTKYRIAWKIPPYTDPWSVVSPYMQGKQYSWYPPRGYTILPMMDSILHAWYAGSKLTAILYAMYYTGAWGRDNPCTTAHRTEQLTNVLYQDGAIALMLHAGEVHVAVRTQPGIWVSCPIKLNAEGLQI